MLPMNRSLLGVVFCLCMFGASALGQSSGPCTVTDHTEYAKKIKEFTTEPFFITELVDHLPLSSCVPPPDAFLHHIVGAPDVLDYTKDINAYMRLLASKSPRVKVWSIGVSEEGREMLVVAIRPPTVATGSSRLRVTLSCDHADEEVDRLIEHVTRIAAISAPGRRH